MNMPSKVRLFTPSLCVRKFMDVAGRVKSIIAPDEPLTPGILYVGVSALTGSILSRGRFLPTRLLLPPIFFFATLNHFLPKTSHNISSYVSELEERYAPGLKEKHDIANAHTRMTWERAKKATRDGREGLGRTTEGLVERIQAATGLKLRETLGWGENRVEKATGNAITAVNVVEVKAGELKDVLDTKVEQAKDTVAESKPERLV